MDGAVRHEHWTTTTFEVLPTAGGMSYTVYPRTTDMVRSEGGSLISWVTTTIDEIDGRGNIGLTTVDRSTGVRETTRTTWRVDPSAWITDLVTSQVVTSYVPGHSAESREVAFNYNSWGEVAEVIREPAALGTSLYHRTKFERNTHGQITSVLEASGIDDLAADARTTLIEYGTDSMYPSAITNALGHRVELTTDRAHGLTTQSRDANGLISTHTYDGFGRAIAVQRPDGSGAGIIFGAAVAPNAFAVAAHENDGSFSSAVYDRLGRETQRSSSGFNGQVAYVRIGYDSMGRVVSESRPYFAGDPVFETTFEYDALGRLRYRRRAAGVYEYRYSGLTVDEYDEERSRKQLIYDGAGRLLTSSIYPEDENGVAVSTQYRYGAFGGLEQVIDAAGNDVFMSHDRLGRQVELVDDDIGRTTTSYDSFDQVISTTDGRLVTTSMTYDRLGRLTERSAPDGADTFVYDNAPGAGIGRLSNKARGTLSTSYVYNSRGLPQIERWIVDGATYEFEVAYDGIGRPARLWYPEVQGRSRFNVENLYQAGNLIGVRDGSSQVMIWAPEDVRADGAILRERSGNGLLTHRTFDPASSRLERIHVPGIAYFPQDMNYTYFANGNVASRTDAWQGLTESFTYDGANRLTSSVLSSGASKVHTYDALGNIVTSSDWPNCSFRYGEGAGPHAVTTVACPGGEYSYAYDGAGNQTLDAISGYQQASWTSFGKPNTIGNCCFGTLRFSYDADHRRIKKESTPYGTPPFSGSSGVWSTTVDLGLYEFRDNFDGTVDHVFSISAGGSRVAQMMWRDNYATESQTEEWRYYHKDLLGSVEKTTDASGTWKELASFSPFGGRRYYQWNWATGYTPPDTRVSYTGHDSIDEFGLVDMGGRIYNPSLKRFLSADPYVQAPEYGPSWNRYSYVWNNPMSMTDPTGYWGDPLELHSGPADCVGGCSTGVAVVSGIVSILGQAFGWLTAGPTPVHSGRAVNGEGFAGANSAFADIERGSAFARMAVDLNATSYGLGLRAPSPFAGRARLVGSPFPIPQLDVVGSLVRSQLTSTAAFIDVHAFGIIDGRGTLQNMGHEIDPDDPIYAVSHFIAMVTPTPSSTIKALWWATKAGGLEGYGGRNSLVPPPSQGGPNRLLPGVRMEDAQLGEKFGQHGRAFGVKPGPENLQAFRELIEGIVRNASEVRQGPWKGGATHNLFYRLGGMVVVTSPNGHFVTILSSGATNGWFVRASPIFRR